MNKVPRLLFTVTTDITYDQRMDRICTTLVQAGYDVTLCGRLKKNSLPQSKKSYKQTRLRCFTEKGKLFYIEYNIKLFFYLLFKKADLICGIDLDTALPALLVAKIKRVPFVYDAHEYFTEMEEVVKRPAVRKFWLMIEEFIIPRTNYAYTVSKSIAMLLEEKYKVPFETIRNISRLHDEPNPEIKPDRYIVYAGAVNEGRGLEELIDVMPQLDVKLMVCGDGDVLEELKQRVATLRLEDKVIFKGYVVPAELKELINKAHIGYLLLTNQGLSYYYSLANKFFDYMHAGIPQVTINFPEYQLLNNEFEVASLVELDRQQIKEAITRLLTNEKYYAELVNNTQQAKLVYNWQHESKRLLEIYTKILPLNE